ncbi:MAG: C2 family cysteine protease [Clostridia bacterium]|nr:C2 family cysteine protease [Clostridia bacterium]
MPKYPNTLFEENPKWGVTPGAHVAHIIDPSRDTTYTEIPIGDQAGDRYAAAKTDAEVRKVTQAEVYTNSGDNATAKAFLKLAEQANNYYKAEDCPDEYKEVLLSVKKYLTAGGRREQQDALKEYKAKALKLYRSAREENARHDDGITSISTGKYRQNERICSELDELTRSIMTVTAGTLSVPENYSYNKKEIKEPGNTLIGKFGIWTSTEDELFGHMPSPNDIKQGYGIHDCYVLSALTKIAETNPEKIKDCMKDNGDGTVTVRFFDYLNPSDEVKSPVYVTVNKTVNRLAGKANVYASSSLWVQMIEKAYIKFCNERRGAENSFNSIDFGGTDDFMNAFDKDTNYTGFAFAFGFGYTRSGDLYNYDKKGNPVSGNDREYLPHEKELYDFLKRRVNDCKEVMTVGNSGQVKNNANFSLDHGIRVRHAYTVNGVFESNGKKYVQLRDPYALFRSKYDENGNLVKDSAALAGTFKAGLSNMGTFNMELKDFQRNFDNFVGMSMGAFNEFDAMRQKWINYDDPQNALQNQVNKANPEPVANDLNDFEVVDDVMPQPAEKQGAIYDKLREPGGFDEVSEVISYLKNDLDTTAMFFSYKNTRPFENMRDKLNDVFDMVSKEMTKENHSGKDLERIGDSLTELSGLAQSYADAKYKSIMDIVAKGKEPSLRAIHRMAAAVTLIGVGKGEMQIAKTEAGFAESMATVKNDITEKIEMIRHQPSSEENQKRLSTLTKAEEVIGVYMEKHPEIKEQTVRLQQPQKAAENSRKAPEKVGEVDDFEVMA